MRDIAISIVNSSSSQTHAYMHFENLINCSCAAAAVHAHVHVLK